MRVSARMRRLSQVLLLAAVIAGLWGGVAAWREQAAWKSAKAISVANWAPGQVVLTNNLWVTRQPGGEFRVFQNRSDFYADRPVMWLPGQARFVEPVSSAEYSIDGVGVFGPAGHLYEVAARLEGDTLMMIPDRVTGGGAGDPAWLFDLKAFFRRLFGGDDPAGPASPAGFLALGPPLRVP